jgi:anti-sigma B factor antagonist
MPGTWVRAPFSASLHGEIDLGRKPELSALVADYRAGAAADATLDLSDVTFLDSSGVAGLVALVKATRERDGAVSLVKPQPIVRKVLQITGVESWFTIVD